MVQVRLGGTLQSYSGGQAAFDIEAENIGQMLTALGEACPRLKPLLDQGAPVRLVGGFSPTSTIAGWPLGSTCESMAAP